jgi:hypothetical protein
LSLGIGRSFLVLLILFAAVLMSAVQLCYITLLQKLFMLNW